MSADKPIPDEVMREARVIASLIPSKVRDENRRFAASVIARSIQTAVDRQREKDALLCEQQAEEFLSPEYAWPQPVGSISERFACGECATAIRNGG